VGLQACTTVELIIPTHYGLCRGMSALARMLPVNNWRSMGRPLIDGAITATNFGWQRLRADGLNPAKFERGHGGHQHQRLRSHGEHFNFACSPPPTPSLIVCWGDSLTGAYDCASQAYGNYLSGLLNIPVNIQSFPGASSSIIYQIFWPRRICGVIQRLLVWEKRLHRNKHSFGRHCHNGSDLNSVAIPITWSCQLSTWKMNIPARPIRLVVTISQLQISTITCLPRTPIISLMCENIWLMLQIQIFRKTYGRSRMIFRLTLYTAIPAIYT